MGLGTAINLDLTYYEDGFYGDDNSIAIMTIWSYIKINSRPWASHWEQGGFLWNHGVAKSDDDDGHGD